MNTSLINVPTWARRIAVLLVCGLLAGSACARPSGALGTTRAEMSWGRRPPAKTVPAPPAPDSTRRRFWLYGELGGAGLLASFNAEYQPEPGIALRCGAGYAFPLMVSFLIGNGRHFLEVGGGADLAFGHDQSGPEIVGLGTIGYRYQRGRRLYRLTCTPIYLNHGFWGEGDGEWLPWFGLSIGGAP